MLVLDCIVKFIYLEVFVWFAGVMKKHNPGIYCLLDYDFPSSNSWTSQSRWIVVTEISQYADCPSLSICATLLPSRVAPSTAIWRSSTSPAVMLQVCSMSSLWCSGCCLPNLILTGPRRQAGTLLYEDLPLHQLWCCSVPSQWCSGCRLPNLILTGPRWQDGMERPSSVAWRSGLSTWQRQTTGVSGIGGSSNCNNGVAGYDGIGTWTCCPSLAADLVVEAGWETPTPQAPRLTLSMIILRLHIMLAVEGESQKSSELGGMISFFRNHHIKLKIKHKLHKAFIKPGWTKCRVSQNYRNQTCPERRIIASI